MFNFVTVCKTLSAPSFGSYLKQPIRSRSYQDYYLNYFSGRRKCLGESVARVENFLFFSNILKNFRLEIPDKMPAPSLDPIDGMTIGPSHFDINFKLRTQV